MLDGLKIAAKYRLFLGFGKKLSTGDWNFNGLYHLADSGGLN
jgi:hypothetical protein